ncbi:hypothetical protein L1987_25248 [Smallanthus sonchifolius]|uniref:Uncharacterized protein n=1 Tax=Smallanthus sonchifolius TaxID=185202 RepID=A0ACB9IQD4_9ASTR|nr:hypothetical protein L1987_25248 [Smallanthus sonchifolius]
MNNTPNQANFSSSFSSDSLGLTICRKSNASKNPVPSCANRLNLPHHHHRHHRCWLPCSIVSSRLSKVKTYCLLPTISPFMGDSNINSHGMRDDHA